MKPIKKQKVQTEIYISCDIEADGPIPGENSMLSLASAAFTADKQMLSTFEENLLPLPDAKQDPQTMQWWATQTEAWQHWQQDQQPAEKVMKNYVNWLNGLQGKPVFVGYPAAYDFMFIYWYLIKFTGNSPFSFSALDIKSLAMIVLNEDYRNVNKNKMPKEWLENKPHTHRPLDDAIAQGILFCNILDYLKQKCH